MNMNQINSTRFQRAEEIMGTYPCIDITEQEYKKAGVPIYVEGNKVYLDDSDSHTVVFGATGSKKTRLLVMPSVEIFCRAGESFVVTDPKGEIYAKTSESARRCGHEVLCLNLRDIKNSDCWNPFKLPYEFYHSGEQGKAMEMLAEIATMFIGADEIDEPYWTNASRDLLVGFLVLMLERCKGNPASCGFRKLVEIWQEYRTNAKTFKETVKKEFGGTLAGEKISIIYNASDRTIGSVEAIVSTGINKLLISEDLIDFLSNDDFDLSQSIRNKTAIYLVIPDENTSYHFVVSLFISQLYEILIREAQSRPNRALEYRMNFMIDEFANIPKISNMVSMITAARSRNIRFQLILQGLAQINMKYEDETQVLFGNCNNWIYLYSKEYDLLKQLSNLCGEVIYENGTRVPLISEFELQHMSKEKGEALVLAGRGMPFITQLRDIDDYTFAELPEVKEKQPEAVKMPVKPETEATGKIEAPVKRYQRGASQKTQIRKYEGTQQLSGRIYVARTDKDGYIQSWEQHNIKETGSGDPREWVYELFGILGLFYSDEELREMDFYIAEERAEEAYERSKKMNADGKKHSIYDLGGKWLKL